MEAEGRQMADGSERSPLVIRVDGLRRVLHHDQVVLFREGHDLVHVAGDSGVMDRNDDPGARRNQRLDLLRVDVGVPSHRVGKDDAGAFPDKRQGRRHEGVGRDDDFVPRLQVAEQRRHLQRIGATGGQQALLEAILFFEETLAAFGELAVPGEFSVLQDGFCDIFGLFPREVRLIEMDHFTFLFKKSNNFLDRRRRKADRNPQRFSLSYPEGCPYSSTKCQSLSMGKSSHPFR